MIRYIFTLLALCNFLQQANATDGKITPIAEQQFLLHTNKAIIYAADSLYQKACDEYELAFAIRKDQPVYLLECAKIYDKLNNTEQTLNYLKLSIEAGCDWYNDTTLLPNLKKTNRYLPLSQYEPLKQQFYKNLNMDYFLELEKMEAEDQVIRNIKRSDYAKLTDEKAKNKLMGIVDSTHIIQLKALVEKYGYPQYATVGYQGETDAFVLLLHGLFDGINDSLDWAYFQPVILNEVKAGRLMPVHYAQLYDRVVSKYGKEKQYYGTQFGVSPTGTFTLVGDIYDIENVDMRRKEIGLATLEDDFKIMKMPLPPGYVKK